ncbi:NADPH-dependent FMN reductase [Tahibacter amnicola]|uniref:NAD(P)H-dependent oxidoreductase n=1 Tax=Tahibacter amnicola TaxID=2976241 RepID=A0ABY6BBE8_9GAMM|nr:NADPH-dependent FMN reductase [Tahibacter amnicola]UXI66862.1 NAD(P)H-dependent oxidoreductase [Tahibacter amnicola]
MSQIRVVGICGSLRKGSYNRALLEVARQVVPEGMTLEVVPIDDLPLYNGDVEAAGLPEAVQRFKQQVQAADAVLFATPEYNYSIPGVLKNAIDWGSRPTSDNSFRDKPMALMGASMGLLGTARSQYHLRQVAVFLDMHVLNKPEVFVGQAQNKFDAEGNLTDTATREHVQKQLVALAAWTRRLRGG